MISITALYADFNISPMPILILTFPVAQVTIESFVSREVWKMRKHEKKFKKKRIAALNKRKE